MSSKEVIREEIANARQGEFAGAVFAVVGVALLMGAVGLWSVTEKELRGSFPNFYERTVHPYQDEAVLMGVFGAVAIGMGVVVMVQHNDRKSKLIDELAEMK